MHTDLVQKNKPAGFDVPFSPAAQNSAALHLQDNRRSTMQMKGKVNINNDKSLEHEADVMGQKALQMKPVRKNNDAVAKILSPAPNAGVVQPFGLGDIYAVAGGIAGGIGGAMLGGVSGAVAGASAGAFAGDKLRKQINNYRNQDTGFEVTVLTSGGFINNIVGKQKTMSRRYGSHGITDAAVKGVIGTAAIIQGHVSIQLHSNKGFDRTFDMGGNGVREIAHTQGSTRETHKITREQYLTIKNRIQQDLGKKIDHVFFDFNMLRDVAGLQNANLASCAGWVISVLKAGNVPAGTLFDRYIMPIPKLMAQSGWDKPIGGAPARLAAKSAEASENAPFKSAITAHQGHERSAEASEDLSNKTRDAADRSQEQTIGIFDKE